jgi:hypothetical protein
MKNMLDTIKGKKKRHTVDISDPAALHAHLEEEGNNTSSPGPQRLGTASNTASPALGRLSHQGSAVSSPSPQRTDSKGKFSTMMGKAKDKMAAALKGEFFFFFLFLCFFF